MSAKNFDKIINRIEFIKKLLQNTDLDPMILYNQNDKVIIKKYKPFKEVIQKIGGKLLYHKSGTTGHLFKGISYPDPNDTTNCINYAVKIVAYPKKENYGEIDDPTRPENAELNMIRLLSYFVINNHTPHIVLPITTFNTDIGMFVTLTKNKIVVNKKYDNFVKRYHDDEFYDVVSVLISEWADNGDLLDYLRNNYTKLKTREWRVLIFQILSVLAVIQTKFPSFRHNDLKANNVLLQKIGSSDENNIYKYNINGKEYYVPNIGLRIKIWDFDFASCDQVQNQKVLSDWTTKINVSAESHLYYDVHYFFNTLISRNFLPNFLGADSDGKPMIPLEVKDFIDRILPEKLRAGKNTTERGRLMLSYDEVKKKFPDHNLTPASIIENDPFFKKMRP